MNINPTCSISKRQPKEFYLRLIYWVLVKVKFEVVTEYQQLAQYFSDFVPLTMDYFIWNFQSRYDFNPESWRKFAGINDNISFTEVIEKFQLQKANRMFSEDFIHRIKKDYNKGMWSFLLYSLEDALIGTARLTKRNQYECELHSLFVEPSYRGKQIGTKLLQKMIEVARKEGYEVIYLATFPFWQSALKLYEKMGFRIIDQIESGFMDRDNTKGIEIFMELRLKTT